MEQERGIRYFPIALFASVMGISGLAMSLRLIENVYEIGHMVSMIVTVLATIMFLINGLFLLYRVIYFFDGVKEDFNHPVKMNFFGAITISLLLLGDLYVELNELLSFYVWTAGALLQVGLTLTILSKLIWNSSFQLPQFNPTWFIPIVGNIVAPLGGVYHVGANINWMFFSLGIMFSIIYMTIFINRIIFHPPLPNQLTPTFFILLAPPSIGLISYVKLTGNVDVFAYVLYGIAFYLGLLFIVQFKRFLTIQFSIAWWAYLFPSAAITNATIYMYFETANPFYNWLFIAQVIGLVGLAIYLLAKTLNIGLSGALFIKKA